MPEVKKPLISPEVKAQAQAQFKEKFAAVEAFLETIIVKRFIGTFIDLVMIMASVVIITLPALFILPHKPVNLAALFNCIIFLVATALVLIKDTPFQFAVLDGRTPGKKAMNTRVTTPDDKPITLMMSIRRNIIPATMFLVSALSSLIYVVRIPYVTEIASLVIIIPLFLLSLVANLFELFKIYTSPGNCRWGDEFAGTIVKLD